MESSPKPCVGEPSDPQQQFRYRPRNPSGTLLYQTVQEHLETFLGHLEADPAAKGMPSYVKDEFYRFLRCGILAHGFIRYRCTSCEEELLVGFSCKRRGFCPSCLGRRMAEVAARLIDHVIPDENIRQWVVTFPFPMRYWCASDKALTASTNKFVVREISRYYRKKAIATRGYPEAELHPGLVTFVQRFGSSLNLHVHFHILTLDGVYSALALMSRRKRTREPEPRAASLGGGAALAGLEREPKPAP